MKFMKKLKFQIEVGLVIGFGVLALAAPAAYAGPPCPKSDCSGYGGFYYQCEKITSPNILYVATPIGEPEIEYTPGDCRNCDGRRASNGTCKTYTTNWSVQYGKCEKWITNVEIPFPDPFYSTTIYNKSFSHHGPPC